MDAGKPCSQHFHQAPVTMNRAAGRPIERFKNMTLDTDPAHGKIVLHENAVMDYIPAKGYRGPDAFDLTICNAADSCATVAYTVEVR